MLVSFLYEIILIFLGLVALPKMVFQFIFKGKYRKSLLKRFGASFPIIQKGKRPLIWIHAVSLGETKAIFPLVKQLKKKLQNAIIVFSTTTETGYVEACRTIAADYHVFLPFDFGWVINPIIKRTKPDLVILCESDFWYNFLTASKKAGATIALVNGKVSTTSLKRYSKFQNFSKALFSKIDLFCVQSNRYRERFESLGVPNEKIIVTGNIKFDGDFTPLPQDKINAWREELGIKSSDPVIVVGSTHNPEEFLCLNAMQTVWERHPNVKIMFVPRHPERFNEVAGILQKNNINFRRLSQKYSDPSQNQVLLIDAMGLLRKCYQLATIAIVGGSYTSKIGGHNILEPCWYGVPVIFGPFMHAQLDLVELVKEYGAGLQTSDEELPRKLIELIENQNQREQYGKGGLRLAEDVNGATKKTWQALKPILATTKIPFAKNKK